MLPEQIWLDSCFPRAGLSRGTISVKKNAGYGAKRSACASPFPQRALEKHDQSLEDVYLDAD